MSIVTGTEVTPRESLLHEWEVEQFKMQAEHAITMKKLELELSREDHQASIELRKLESKWASWLRLPKLIVLSPALFVLSIAYGFKREAPRKFWDLIS